MEKVSLESEIDKQAVIRLAMESLSLEHAFEAVIERGLFECSEGNWVLMGVYRVKANKMDWCSL